MRFSITDKDGKFLGVISNAESSDDAKKQYSTENNVDYYTLNAEQIEEAPRHEK